MRVLSGDAARQALLAPLRQSVRAINASLGPHGRALLYEATPGGVGFAHDGLSIAREMADSEGARSIGPRILKETLFAAERDFGDGAARLACILGAIFGEGVKLVAAGHPPQRLADDILQVGDLVRHRLDEQRSAPPDLRALASAVTSDDGIAEAVAQAVARAGADGVVDVKDDKRAEVHLEFGVGFAMDAALPSEHLGAIAPATVLELDAVFVLVANENVSEFGRLGPILEGFAARKKSLAIVARDISGAALEALVRNRREIGLQVVALKPTDVSSRAGQVLEDLAIATGATLVATELGSNLDSLRPSMLGRARRLRFAKGRALFVEPTGDRAAIEERRRMIGAEAEKARYLAYDREHALRRGARLAGNWAEVGVGGHSVFETALKLTEARAAVHALQAALRSGVVAGGGSALVREAARLRAGDGPGSRGARLCVARGLEAVTTHIAGNAGLDPAAPLAALRRSEAKEIGLDARSGRICDARCRGDRRPAFDLVGVLMAAVSAAATMLRIEAMVCR